jgi:hypothetical protein
LKLIGERADAYCWHINGDDDPYKKSSLAHLLGISQVEVDLIMEMSGCFDKEKQKVDMKHLDGLVDTVGKEHCELIKYRLKHNDGCRKMLFILRIGIVQGANTIPLPKFQFKQGCLIIVPPKRSHIPRLNKAETTQLDELLSSSRRPLPTEREEDPIESEPTGHKEATTTNHDTNKSITMHELESKTNENIIATVFGQDESPQKVTLVRMQRSIRRCIAN